MFRKGIKYGILLAGVEVGYSVVSSFVDALFKYVVDKAKARKGEQDDEGLSGNDGVEESDTSYKKAFTEYTERTT